MRRFLYLTLVLFATPAWGQFSLQRVYPLLPFDNPVEVRTPPDGTGRLFVVEHAGTIQVAPDDPTVTVATTFLDISSRVQQGGEAGLLSLVFHPDYATNRQFFVYYIALEGSQLVSIVERYEVSADPDFAFVGSAFEILRFDQPAGFHNGGELVFDDEGYLYLSLGDGGSPSSAAQDRTNLLGTVIRIDVDGGIPYAIPPSNPYFQNGLGYREEIYAYGLRNPWRMSYDPMTDTLWLGDVGQNEREEVDVVLPGRNYGWDHMEGNNCRPGGICPPPDYEPPVYEYAHTGNLNTVIGGMIYRGGLHPSLVGKYIFGDFGSGSIWALDVDFVNPPVRSDLASVDTSTLASFGLDGSGEILVVTYGGWIHRLVAPGPVAAPESPGLRPLQVWPNQPNPFNPRTVLRFRLAAAHPVSIQIYDLQGRRIRRLAEGSFPAGEHRLTWDGHLDDGSSSPSGVYLARIQAGPHRSSVRMVLAR